MNADKSRFERLSTSGRAIHGDDWQSPNARSFRITGRHLRRWVSGDRSVPAWVDQALPGILKEAAARSAGHAADLESLSVRFAGGHGGN